MIRSPSLRKMMTGAGIVALVAALGVGQTMLQDVAAQGKQGPRFEVDPFWPKPMPDNWVLGQAIGVGVDERDNVWIVHRGDNPANLDNTELAFPPARNGLRVSECCMPAPPVIAFDPAGGD